MADTKISALPAATTPLGATDQIPVVQGGETRRVPASAFGGGGATLHPGHRNDRWYTGNDCALTTQNGYAGNGTFYLYPIVLPATVTIAKVACVVQAGGSGTSNIQFAFYTSLNGAPSNRVLVTPTMDAISTGEKIAVLGTPVTLPAGTYWVGSYYTGGYNAQFTNFPVYCGDSALFKVGHQYLQTMGPTNPMGVAASGVTPSNTTITSVMVNTGSAPYPVAFWQVS